MAYKSNNLKLWMSKGIGPIRTGFELEPKNVKNWNWNWTTDFDQENRKQTN